MRKMTQDEIKQSDDLAKKNLSKGTRKMTPEEKAKSAEIIKAGAGMEPAQRKGKSKGEGSGLLGALQGEEVSPETQREIEVMKTATIKLMHDKTTQKSIIDMLSSGDIAQSVPATALQVNSMLEQSMTPKPDVVLANSVGLVSDLLELAAAAGIADMPPEEEIVGIYQDTLQKYIQKGLKDGSIDPVELQQSVEPLMDEEQMQAGRGAMTQAGLPEAATSGMATDRLVNQAVKKEQGKAEEHGVMMRRQSANAIPGKQVPNGGRI